jgi:O-antigen biosynthesis protein
MSTLPNDRSRTTANVGPRPEDVDREVTTSVTPRAFRARRVLDVPVDPTTPLADLHDLGAYEVLFGIVRVLGRPVGYAEIPITAGGCSSRQLTMGVFTQCEGAIVNELLARALADGTFPSGPGAMTDPEGRERGHQMPSLTVAVCTRDRTEDLARCLASLDRLDYPVLERLVVDNAPPGDATARLVKDQHPGVRYVHEPCPGLNWARRRAVAEATGDIIAFVDDDVVADPDWARHISAVLRDNPDVMAVTGLVVPFELETEAQLRFERLGGLGKGFVRQWHRTHWQESAGRRYANTGPLGVGANMAFRRSVFREVGPFDPALGAGTTTGGGDDLDAFFRVLKAGHTLVYEPAAFVRHRHRRDDTALKTQVRNWSMGMQAYLRRGMRAFPDERATMASLAARLLLLYYPRRVVQSLVDPTLHTDLAMAEWRGAIAGLSRYGPARERARARAVEFDRSLEDDAPHTNGPGRGPMRARRTIRVDLDVPLPEVMPGPDDSDEVQMNVVRGGQALGSATVVSGGHPVSRARASDAILAALGRRGIDPADVFGRALRSVHGLL